MSEEQQRDFLAVLGSALKATPVGVKIDVNKTLYKVGSELPRYFVGEALELSPLARVLGITPTVTPSEIAVVCLLVKRREDRLGVEVKLPAEVQALSEQARGELLAALPKNTGTGTTNAAASMPRPPPPEPSAASLVAAAVADSSAPITSAPVAVKRKRRSPVLLGVLALLLLGAVWTFLGDSNLKRISPELPPELKGLKVYEYNGVVFYFDGSKDFDRPPQELVSMAKAGLTVAQSVGAHEAWFCANEDRSCTKALKFISRPQGVVYVDPVLKRAAPQPAPAPVPPPTALPAPTPAPAPSAPPTSP